MRDTQLQHLLERLRQESLPVIVAGDFNLSEHSLPYGALSSILRDAYREAGRGFGHTWPAHYRFPPPVIRIDYIWHSPDFHTLSAQVGVALGADHLPVIARLVW